MNFSFYKAITMACVLIHMPIVADDNVNFSIPTTKKSIKIDADLTDPAWQKAHKININNVTWPSENTPSPVKTEALIIEDGEVLYVAFKAFDNNPEEIRANLTDRDNNWNDDKVAIKIDTYGDSVLAYQFFINPLGTQSDVIENEITKQESASWDVIWDSAGKITEFGYVVEVAIPLRNLNFNDSLDIQKWKMEFVRFYPRSKELRISNLQMSHNNNCWICQMGEVTGLKGAKQGNNFTAVPTFVSGSSETRDLDETTDWSSESNTDVGLDVKWGITPDVTLNATFNPDFSQVEADSGQLNVNSTFALFTPEKRAFFLANQDYFSTPVNLIYTRNINAPDYGAKITGKTGAHSFGAFAANDASTSFLLPGNLSSNLHELEEKSTNGVFRYRYAFNKNASLGTTTTIRESDSYHNYLTSVDGKYKPTENDTFDVQVMRSDTSMTDTLIADIKADASDEQVLRADQINTEDLAFQIQYRHENRDWFFNARHENTGENFRADLAFFNNSDKVKNVIGGGRTWRGDDSDWLHRIQLSGDWDRTTNQQGDQIEQELEMYLNLNGPNQFFSRTGMILRENTAGRIDGSTLTIKDNTYVFDEQLYRTWNEFKPMPNLWLGNFIQVGEVIDYDNKQLAKNLVIEPNISWNINTHLSTRLTYKYNKLDDLKGNSLLTAKLTDFRLTYQFSIRSFLRLSMVYFDIERSLENYNQDIRDDYDARYRNLSTQLLFSYKVNPQTLFFIGYSDGAKQDDDLNSLTKNNRSAFMKLSYAWLL
ncbi:MAG: carbohydrate binding family 9 domain-containing protein [Gammaproteobacteria bacterium]|nr:carbohydrate binding family 9 domain-containing protein [Gammaproteobacteria bacterium]